ncbi:hypothetical protein NQ314_004398 [Rhamnusium bicolor]|uniref:Uncharacterized protein n=1 Tax=Rhamnusium bicolor TaxID=1586634 RepID=A0AAV8ZLV8_9CUCU|nr:hypothetical protein NQ314_004398 [Rhamnusium bicolor]
MYLAMEYTIWLIALSLQTFLKFMPVSDAVWKLQIWGIDLKPVSCIEMELQVASFLGGRRRGGK